MYVVKKPFDAGGKRWKIGEIIQDDGIRSSALIRGDYVAKIDSGLLDLAGASVSSIESVSDEGYINIPIITEDGSMGLPVAPAVICEALRLFQIPANDAIEEIKDIGSDDLLIILDACDQRKNVKAAVRKRAAVLEEARKTEEK